MAKKGEYKKGATADSVRQRKYNSSSEQKKNRASRNAARRAAEKAGKVRKGDGRDPSNVELYMYHFLGRDGAGEFLNAPKDKPAIDFVSKGAASANKTVFYKGGEPRTVGEVLNNFARKF